MYLQLGSMLWMQHSITAPLRYEAAIVFDAHIVESNG